MSTAIYARVSTDSDDQAGALEQQLERLRKACPDALEFVDIESGTVTDRPQWEALMQGCRSGVISRVVSTRLDRISRSRVQGAQILQFFMRPQAPSLELLDDSLNLSTSGGRFMADLLIAWAVSESERLGERTRHGHAHRRSLNKPFGPKPPVGYIYTKGKANYALDPKVAPGAKKVIEFFLNGEGGLRAAVQYAQKEHGITFASHSSLKRWLLNPTLAGFRVYGVSTVEVLEDGTKKRTHNRPGVYGQVIPDAHPALISEATHARLVAMFEGSELRSPCR